MAEFDVEVSFIVKGFMYFSRANLCDYIDDKGNIDYKECVSDNISLDTTGSWDVVEIEVFLTKYLLFIMKARLSMTTVGFQIEKDTMRGYDSVFDYDTFSTLNAMVRALNVEMVYPRECPYSYAECHDDSTFVYAYRNIFSWEVFIKVGEIVNYFTLYFNEVD